MKRDSNALQFASGKKITLHLDLTYAAALKVHSTVYNALAAGLPGRTPALLAQMHNDQRSAGLVLQSMSVHGNNYHSSPQLPPGLLPAHPNSSLVASPAR